MSIFFWRKTTNIAPENSLNVAVSEDTPLPVQIFHLDDHDIAPVRVDSGNIDPKVSTPVLFNVTLTSASTEYSLVLPAGCRRIEFQCRTAFDVVFAFEAGHVATPTAPYMTLKAGDYYDSGAIYQGDSKTLYLASTTAAVVVEIIAWI